MKISEILKMLIEIVKYFIVFYLFLNLVAYIYFYISQPKEMSRSKRQEKAFDMILEGNALMYVLLSDIFRQNSIIKNRSNSILPYNSVSDIHYTNGY